MGTAKQPKLSLRTKMTFITMTSILSIIVVLGIYFAVSSWNMAMDIYVDEATALAASYGTAIKNQVDSLSEQIDVVTENRVVVDENTPLDERKQLLIELAEASNFLDFSVAYSDGTTYNGTDISARDYFQNAMASKGAYISSPVMRLTDNALTVMMGKYFSANGKDYLAYGGLSTDTFSDLIADVQFGDVAVCFIIDKDKKVIASSEESILPLLTDLSDKSQLSDKIDDLAYLASSMSTYSGGTSVVDYNGENYFFGYTDIEGAEGWSLALGTPRTPISTSIFFQIVIFIIVAVVIAALAIVSTRVIISNICSRITKTSERLASFAQGDISSPAPEFSSGDEIELMGDSLKEMISSLGEYINDIRTVLQGISDGDLTVQPEAAYNGEFSEIKTSLEKIVYSLGLVMADVGKSAHEVREGASQLADGSSQLSQNAIAQAEAVDEITSTVLDISQKTEANTENVRKALEAARNTNNQAQDGSRSMEEMLKAFDEIEESSKEIGHIIGVIDDIAFQTNILALNAAIEAARAGEAGKGFAVVADEVGNLAGKSAEAAKQTGQLISRSIDAVNRGAQLADAASGALSDIVRGVEEVSNVMNDISHATDEQASAVEQISVGMGSVNSAIHTTTATAEQSAAASEELSALAVSLADVVSRFRLG